MYIALGLGALTKGPVAVAIPALVCFVYVLVEGRASELRRLMLPAGTLIVLAIVLPWYVAIYAQHGWDYIKFFFLDENLGRFASAYTTERNPLFLVGVLLGDNDPAGVRVAQVVPNSPAEEAGIEEGDLILSVDGKPVAKNEELQALMEERKPGDSVELRVRRKVKGKDDVKTLKAKLEKSPN